MKYFRFILKFIEIFSIFLTHILNAVRDNANNYIVRKKEIGIIENVYTTGLFFK